MRKLHGSRSATRSHHPAASVTPNAGRFPPPETFARASDDVLISHVGWPDLSRPADHISHRPGPDGLPACGAALTVGVWQRISAGHARTLQASQCPHRECGGGAVAGWSSW